MSRWIIAAACIASTLQGHAAEDIRLWSSGDFSVKGVFIGLVGDTVAIQLTNGDQVEIPLQSLSLADQHYVKNSSGPNTSPFEPTKRAEDEAGDLLAESVADRVAELRSSGPHSEDQKEAAFIETSFSKYGIVFDTGTPHVSGRFLDAGHLKDCVVFFGVDRNAKGYKFILDGELVEDFIPPLLVIRDASINPASIESTELSLSVGKVRVRPLVGFEVSKVNGAVFFRADKLGAPKILTVEKRGKDVKTSEDSQVAGPPSKEVPPQPASNGRAVGID